MRTSVLFCFILVCATITRAADQLFDIKPGLWEFTTSAQTSGLPPMPNLDQLTPEQRARVEAMLKNSGAHAVTSKACVTREGIEKAIGEANSNKDRVCAPKLVSTSPSKLVVHIECAMEGRDTKSIGDMVVEREDSEHFKVTGAVKMTTASGRTMEVKSSMTGAFVSEDCGNLKPAGQQ